MDERLYQAAIRGNVEKLLDMLKEDVFKQADEPLLDRVMRDCIGKDNLLHLGALFGRVEFVREISSRKPEFARQLNSQGLSPLHLAVEAGYVEVVKVMLETDADVCFVRDRDGRIPLHLAVIKGRVNVIEELVKAKSITAWLLTEEREPILHFCAKHDQFDAFEKLVRLVNDDDFVRLKDRSDNTILHLLSANKQIKMVEFLLNTTTHIDVAVINALNVDKLTALDELHLRNREAGCSELKKLLCGKGAERSSDMSSPTNSPLKLSKHDSKGVERLEPSLLVFATLVITVTYTAALSPPGGYWSDDSQPGSIQDHKAGDPIFLSKNRLCYYLFYIFNGFGFSASIAVIMRILFSAPDPPPETLGHWKYFTVIVMYSLVLSYIFTLVSTGGWWTLVLPWVTMSLCVLMFRKLKKCPITWTEFRARMRARNPAQQLDPTAGPDFVSA